MHLLQCRHRASRIKHTAGARFPGQLPSSMDLPFNLCWSVPGCRASGTQPPRISFRHILSAHESKLYADEADRQLLSSDDMHCTTPACARGEYVHSCKALFHTVHPPSTASRTSSIARAAIEYPSEVRSQEFLQTDLASSPLPNRAPRGPAVAHAIVVIDKGRRVLDKAVRLPQAPASGDATGTSGP